jgi:hypothetical protein
VRRLLGWLWCLIRRRHFIVDVRYPPRRGHMIRACFDCEKVFSWDAEKDDEKENQCLLDEARRRNREGVYR